MTLKNTESILSEIPYYLYQTPKPTTIPIEEMDRDYHFTIVCPNDPEETRKNDVTLFIQTFYKYHATPTEGYIEFDGYLYWNIGDEKEFPRTLTRALLTVAEIAKEGTYNSVTGSTHHELLACHVYEVEFTRRVLKKNTNSYSKIEEEDGSEMNVCFFPTEHQVLHFRILQNIPKGAPLPPGYD